MSVSVKSNREIELMREAGKILGTVLNELSKEIKPGMTTHRIDQLGEEMIRSYGCIPSFLGYGGFPASICVSVNEEVVHGIPSKKRILHEGDIVSMDAGVIYKGYHSDAARTVGVGEISKEAQQLIEVTKQSFLQAFSLQKKAVIYMKFQMQLLHTMKVTGTALYVIWWDTESEQNSTKTRRYRILHRNAEVSSFTKV